jgi:hypothetical protein
VVERTLAVQQAALGTVGATLASDRTRLVDLRRDDARDRRLLAMQLVHNYESPPPTFVDILRRSVRHARRGGRPRGDARALLPHAGPSPTRATPSTSRSCRSALGAGDEQARMLVAE